MGAGKWLRWLERQRDKLYRGPMCNFFNPGPFHVVYPDGKVTRWTDYQGCKNFQQRYGGKIYHRNQLIDKDTSR